MNQLIQDLKKARAVIEDPRHWTRGRLTDGNAYCLLGAIEMAVNGIVTTSPRGPDNIGRIEACKSTLREVIGKDVFEDRIAWYNDRHTHEEVLGILDQAIKTSLAGRGRR
jgi:hypothetical protein